MAWNDEPLIVLVSTTIALAMVEAVLVGVMVAMAGAARAASAATATAEAATAHLTERNIVGLLVVGARNPACRRPNL
jgi:hypothetical protein